jgi:hypothetical protein
VYSSLTEIGAKDSTLVGLALALGGRNSVLDEAASFFARRTIAKRYGIEETQFMSLLLSCCCLPCSNLQIVNTVVVRENMKYECAGLSKIPPPEKPFKKRVVPKARKIERR